MLNSLLNFDTQAFIFINHLPHNFFLDLFFGVITIIGSEGAIWVLIAFLFWKTKKRGNNKKWASSFILAFILGLALETIFKDYFQRPRPYETLNSVLVFYNASYSYSFPSGHTILAFASAYVLSSIKKLDELSKYALYLLAGLIAFSRIYLGQHYPLDVLAGLALGLLIGFVSLKITARSN